LIGGRSKPWVCIQSSGHLADEVGEGLGLFRGGGRPSQTFLPQMSADSSQIGADFCFGYLLGPSLRLFSVVGCRCCVPPPLPPPLVGGRVGACTHSVTGLGGKSKGKMALVSGWEVNRRGRLYAGAGFRLLDEIGEGEVRRRRAFGASLRGCCRWAETRFGASLCEGLVARSFLRYLRMSGRGSKQTSARRFEPGGPARTTNASGRAERGR